MDHLYAVTLRKTIDTFIQLRASSPERALQLATNIAAGKHVDHDATGEKIDEAALPNSVKRVPR